MFYILPVLLLLAALPAITNKTRKEQRMFFLFVVVLTIVTGLRKVSPFPDLPNYEHYFFTGEYAVSYASTENINIGYELLNNLFHWSNSFHILLFAITVFVMYGFSKTIARYSPYLFFSLFLFAIVDFHLSCFLLRQYLAVAVCLLSIPFIIERKLVKYLLCMVVASSFHTSALAFVPMYFLYRNHIKHSYKVAVYTGFGFAILFGGTIVVLLTGFLNTYYQHYLLYEGGGSIARLLMKVYLLFIYVYVLKNKVWDRGINQTVFFMMLMSVFICVCGLSIPIFYRMRMMYSISEILGIPLIILYCKNKQQLKRLVIYSMVGLYILVLAISYRNTLLDNDLVNAFDLFWR